jgi:uncharacterized protein (DUF1810 family)
MDEADPFDLNRFLRAQEPVMDAVRRELAEGRKRTHWMWFVFPQLRGLGHSSAARFYGIGSLDEARAYLAHPVLGGRLRACTALVNQIQGQSAQQIFGNPDDMKFHSSLTLFSRADPANAVFRQALATYFGGTPDARTVELLG